jgi:hypothetical protein
MVVAQAKQQTSRVCHGSAMGHTILDFKTETTAQTCGAGQSPKNKPTASPHLAEN